MIGFVEMGAIRKCGSGSRYSGVLLCLGDPTPAPETGLPNLGQLASDLGFSDVVTSTAGMVDCVYDDGSSGSLSDNLRTVAKVLKPGGFVVQKCKFGPEALFRDAGIETVSFQPFRHGNLWQRFVRWLTQDKTYLYVGRKSRP